MRSTSVFNLLIVALAGLILLPRPAIAQPSSGIAGVVRDASGGVLPGVTVEASSPALIEKVRAATTDAQGRYSIMALVPGVYSVTFTLTGFNTSKHEGIALADNFTATVNADLRVGGIEETITVSGQSPVVDLQNATARNRFYGPMIQLFSSLKLAQGDTPEAALPLLEDALRQMRTWPDSTYAIVCLCVIGDRHLALGNTAAAVAASREATTLQSARARGALALIMSSTHIWWRHCLALRAAGDEAAAHTALRSAYELLVEAVAHMGDEGLRRSTLNKIESHREVVRAWIGHARARRLPFERIGAHLAGPANLREPFSRLADTSLRLNELRSAAELH